MNHRYVYNTYSLYLKVNIINNSGTRVGPGCRDRTLVIETDFFYIFLPVWSKHKPASWVAPNWVKINAWRERDKMTESLF